MQKRKAYMATQFQTREEQESGDLILSGYFIKFDEETELWPGYFEVIKREGVEKAIKDADIRALFNHDHSLVLGRTGNDTVRLGVDDVGLFGDIIINKDDPQAVGAYARVQRGDVIGCSFGFFPIKINTEERDDGSYLDTILDLEIFEVSPCTFPAYPQTEIAARQKDFESQLRANREMLDQRKKEIKEKFKL
ncbi:TPA: HK97 family phage prohead protease [Streptococcus suis]|uniref:Bacteriophage maturation protease n=1 Tax=Streptococcus suis TaxID=1307 RepID=A0A0Z9EY93_STRSU|nr:HK97 family phage prohead protease [Streptococcus suis]MDN2966422.1 HK97 family phage prohead protease [Streptococcus suis]MDN2981759.1 HK97 family phage prohead protease [Streptococcus suis]MDN2983688.1 HK97 family phage prohead protease [Streptococcus suis]MDN2985638.1 HK97 family phage prohead protease [Streptococcus suis]MDS1367874.1 HK97 family phage prohead protease [Streptococcus suis]